MKLRTVSLGDFEQFRHQQSVTLTSDEARLRIQELIQRASPSARRVIDQVYMIERRQSFARRARGSVDREAVDLIVALILEEVQ